MTEVEWLTCRDPQEMLEFLWDKVSERKQYLLGVAVTGLNRATLRAIYALRSAERGGPEAIRRLAKQLGVAADEHLYDNIKRAGEARYPGLLREVFGNPFRPLHLDPSWQTPQVLALAQAAYDNRTPPDDHLDPARLAVLADALEEAGCTERAILDHLRSAGPHVRGCWAVDLLLGKE
jgi:hypothetical protein